MHNYKNMDLKQRERWRCKTIRFGLVLALEWTVHVHDLFQFFVASKYSKNLPSLLNVKPNLLGLSSLQNYVVS